MSGERDLAKLLSGLQPVLDSNTYVFATLPDRALPAGLNPLMQFHEAEGLTVILTEQEAADHQIEATFLCRRITLEIHSSLEAVGMMAAITAALTDHQISCNPIAGYFHDHLFVPVDDADKAMTVIQALTDQDLK